MLLPFVLGAYACRVMPDCVAKQRLLVSFLRGMAAELIENHAEWFCRNWLQRNLHPVGTQLLRQHQRAGTG